MPERFTEWVQWRKLFDRDLSLARLTDKSWSKDLVERSGAAAVIPTLWRGTTLPQKPLWPLPLIVKSNHGCNQFIVVRSNADWQRARRLASNWLHHPYGRSLDEWHYRAARRFIIVEPFIGPAEGLPIDYKIYVIGGRAELVQVHTGRGDRHRWTQWSRDGQLLSRHLNQVTFEQPLSLPEMFSAAETLAGKRDFLRVDFYDNAGLATFGEFCLYPGSGLDPFYPDELDLRLGLMWSAQRSAVSSATRFRPTLVIA
jgi:hypothetical protein